MASFDKLLKALEAVRLSQSQKEKPKDEPSQSKSNDKSQSKRPIYEHQHGIAALASGLTQQGQNLLSRKEQPLTSKDKIMLCHTLSDPVLSGGKSGPETQKLLSIGMESLLGLLDDADPDVRTNADEALNKIIRTSTESYNSKIQLELFKEIKKNGSFRCLRGALSRFALLCHHIRPQKCRAYVQNLLSPLTKIAKRTEESLLETLAQSLEKILPVLGHFTNDNEIRTLMRAFLPSISNPSASIRRSAASSLIVLCRYSRKPNFFFLWLLDNVLQALVPVQDDIPRSQVLGGLLLIRSLVPQFPQLSSQNKSSLASQSKLGWPRPIDIVMSLDQTLQVYELCLHYSRSQDKNIVTTSLEALQALLQNMSTNFFLCLVSEEGIGRSRITEEKPKKLSSRAPSQLSIIPVLVEEEDNTLGLSDRLDLTTEEPIIEADNLSKEELEGSVAVIGQVTEVAGSQCASIDESDNQMNYSSIEIGKITDESPLLGRIEIDLEKDFEGQKEKQDGSVSEDELLDDTVKNQQRVGDIGSYFDKDVPLKYLVRYLCSSYLLAGQSGVLLPDQHAKVSIKALALSCTSYALSLQPPLIKQKLFITTDLTDCDEDAAQRIEDILLYQNHPDPQLRANSAIIIGHFITTSFITNNGSFNCYGRSIISLECLLDSLCRLLACKSSVTVRGALSGLRCCLSEILTSPQAGFVLPVVEHLIKVTSNSYWLVKVDLCELLAELPVKFIDHLESNEALLRQQNNFANSSGRFSHRIVHEIFCKLAADHDPRVQTSATKTIARLLPQLMLSGDVVMKSCAEFISSEPLTEQNEFTVVEGPSCGRPKDFEVESIPFHRTFQCDSNTTVSLSKIIRIFSQKLFLATDKFSRLGCLEILSSLCDHYPPSRYYQAWVAHVISRPAKQTPVHFGLVTLVLSLTSEVSLSGHLAAQQYALNIATNCLAGLAVKNCRTGQAAKSKNWECFSDDKCGNVADGLVKHVLRILNVYSHILEDIVPGSKTFLPLVGAGSSLSPIKRKSKTESTDKTSNSTNKPDKSDDDKGKRNAKIGVEGMFAHLPEYIKLYDVLKNAHNNYKMSLEPKIKSKLCGLLQTALESLGLMLELASSKEIGGIAEEILHYLKGLSPLQPAHSIHCGRQLLRCLFGSNVCSYWKQPEDEPSETLNEDADMSTSMMTSIMKEEEALDPKSLYSIAFTGPMLLLKKDVTEIMEGKRDLERRIPAAYENCSQNMNKNRAKPSVKMTLSYIRLFEPLVIKALKLYTISSDVHLQRSVLDLLINLVQIHVNYCLLDSEQIFIGYVIKQFEYIEEGQILRAEELIPSMFNFLVLLSYERHHSKSIIGVPKIIQLCDGLMASGQPPLSHCILALEPLVKDLFLERGNSLLVDQNELDTQKEVLCSMLIRLAHYYQVLHLLSLVLVSTHNSNKDRWRKLSHQILEVLLPAISHLQINIGCEKSLYAVEEVLSNVCPSVFRPPDELLKAMLSSPCEIETTEGVERWVGGVLILFRVLITRTPIDLVLVRLEQLGLSMEYGRSEPSSLSSSLYQSLSPKRTIHVPDSPGRGAFRDPLNVSQPTLMPQMVLARFFLEVVKVSAFELRTMQLSRVHTRILGDTSLQSDSAFLAQLTQQLLMMLLHLAEIGHWEALVLSLKETCHNDVELSDEIGDALTDVAGRHPYLALLWCKLMTHIDLASQPLWSKVLGSSQRKTIGTPNSEPSFIGDSYIPNCLTLEFVRRSGILILSEFVIRHMQEGEWLTWLVVQHIGDVVRLSKEPPVHNLLQEIYASSAASALLIQAVHARIEDVHMGIYGREIVSLVSGVHVKQSGPLIVFLVEKLLPSSLLVISRLASSLCSQRIYLLLSTSSDVPHILPQDVKKLISTIRDNSIHKRYSKICLLLQHLLDQEHQRCSVFPSSDDLSITPASETSLDLNWFLHLVRNRCSFKEGGGQECSQLLSHLDYSEALSIMSSKQFNKQLLSNAIRQGLVMTLQANMHWTDCGSSVETGDSEEEKSGSSVAEAPLYTASKIVLIQSLQKLIAGLPKQHMVYSPGGGNKYSERLSKLFANDLFTNITIETTSAAVLEYMNSLTSLLWKTELHPDEADSLLMFAVVGFEYLHWHSWLGKLSVSTCHAVTSCVNSILFNTCLFNLLSLSDKNSLINSMVSCLHAVVSTLNKKTNLPSLPLKLHQALAVGVTASANSAQKMTQLILWVEQRGHKSLPASLAVSIRGIIIALARTNLLNGIARVPPELWNLGWDPELFTDSVIAVPPLPSDMLQETDVLKQFIFRIGLLGFLGRHQFEETWMVLLSVLNSTPTPETPPQEIPYINLSLSLAVRGTTALLVQTLLMPHPGNPHSSTLLNIPRDKPPAYLTTKGGQKLQNVMQQLHQRLKAVNHVIRGVPNKQQQYHAGQVSVEYLAAAVMSTHPVDDSPQHVVSITGCYEFEIREKELNSCGLDVQSCLHFLHYLYSTWLQSDLCSTVIAEVVKSVSILCDLFTSASHHRWVLESLVPLYSTHPLEDYITGQYIILATSKALATLKLAQKEVGSSLIEGVLHIVESGLRHIQVSVRTCSLQGLLYLLQARLDENSSLIHMATAYIIKYTEGKNIECEDHAFIVWDLCVYLVEHYPNLPDTSLPSTALHMALTAAASSSTSPRILNKTLQGVERLVLVHNLPPNTVEVVLKLVMDLVLNSPPSVSLAALPLFITALYVSTSADETVQSPVDMIQSDPELLLQLMEKISILFDKIRGGYPYEASVLSGLLGTCLLDILPASQILNKVITEYISSHQPHPHLLAATLFQVFEGAISEGGNTIVQEWVLLSLSNFTQRVPVSLAVWCLTCFFIAASSDRWLRAAFPSVQARLGKLEARDIQIFCLAATHFRQSLPTDDQKDKFDDAFEAVATSGSPFEDLLKCIECLEKTPI